MRWWHDLTSGDFREIDSERAVALLPVAATEQHGPHLAVSVDADINAGIVAKAFAEAPADLPVYVLPMTSVGKSNEHSAYPGTLTLRAETLIALWTDIGESVARAGFRKIVLLNSHGGQPQVMEIVVRDLRVRLGMLAVGANTYGLRVPSDLFSPEELQYGIHAGEVETSMMLHLQPGRVKRERFADFRPSSIALEQSHEVMKLEGAIGLGWMSQDLHPLGAAGDARRADAERGRLCVNQAAARLLTLLDEVSRFPLSWLKSEARA